MPQPEPPQQLMRISNADYSTPVKGPCQASATSTPAERGPSQALKCERWCQRHAILVGVRDGLFEEPASQVHAGDEGCTWSVPVRRRSCRSVWPPTSCHGRLCSHLWQPTRSSLTAEPKSARPWVGLAAGGRYAARGVPVVSRLAPGCERVHPGSEQKWREWCRSAPALLHRRRAARSSADKPLFGTSRRRPNFFDRLA